MSHFQLALPSSMAWNDRAFGIAAFDKTGVPQKREEGKVLQTFDFTVHCLMRSLGCIHLVPSSSRAVYQPYPLLDFMLS